MIMSETVHNLITAIASGNALDTETAFNAAMAEKISARLDDMRVSVAQNLFKEKEVEQEVSVEPSVDTEQQTEE
jgi:hypothetical protein